VALIWTDATKPQPVRAAPPQKGEWMNGMFVPAEEAAPATRTTLIHDVIRALLDLRAA
jgi:hypothetical protein